MPPDIDPAAFQLAAILTAAGATVAAALIATVIQLVKVGAGPVGRWLDADHEAGVAEILALILVVYAFLATTPVVTAVNAFAAFLAWVGIAALATKAYDVAKAGVAAVKGSGG